jgi:hypothetical protein
MVISPSASVKGVFDFPCPREAWVGTLMAPPFDIQRVFIMVNMQDVVALPTVNA